MPWDPATLSGWQFPASALNTHQPRDNPAASAGPQEQPGTSLPNLASIPPCKLFWSTVIKISLRGSWKSQRPFLIKWSTVHFESLTGSIKITGRRQAGHITLLSSRPGQSPSPKTYLWPAHSCAFLECSTTPDEIWPPFKASSCSHLLPEAFPGPTSCRRPAFPLKSCSHVVYLFTQGFIVVCLKLLFTTSEQADCKLLEEPGHGTWPSWVHPDHWPRTGLYNPWASLQTGSPWRPRVGFQKFICESGCLEFRMCSFIFFPE